MKFRRRTTPHVLGFQIAPMVDILLVLLCFFIVTGALPERDGAGRESAGRGKLDGIPVGDEPDGAQCES
jgi:hypothetical protein